jgi:type IV secretion system protein VirB10
MTPDPSDDASAHVAAGGAAAPQEHRPQESPATNGGEATFSRRPASEQGVSDERGIPSVNRIRSVQSRVTALLSIGLTSLTALGLLTWYYHRALGHPVHTDSRLHQNSAARAQTDVPLPPLGPIHRPREVLANAAEMPAASPAGAVQTLLGPPPPLPAATLEPTAAAGSLAGAGSSVPGAAPASARGSPRHKSLREIELDRRLDGAVSSNATASPVGGNAGGDHMVAGAAASPPAAGGVGEGAADVGPAYPAAPGTASAGGLQALLTADVTPAVSAQVLPTQRFLIPKGAFIDCTLETAIDSTLPGMTTCVTATDTFGADGKVVLLERGTKLVGETRGTVQQGQARVFVLWTEARTPMGVVVPLASPGTDELGRSGLPGEVDRHFFERFGAALLISMIDIGVESATQRQSGGVIINPTTPEAILTEVLQSTLNIPPTVRIAQGQRIQVLVARDLDFRRVYQLKLLQVRPTAGASEPAG